jgi:cobaltochelatase CobN
MLLLDSRPYWFHSLDDGPLIVALYDYIEALLAAGRHLPPPPALSPHLFNGFAWDGEARRQGGRELATTATALGEGILILSQADTDLLTLEQARPLLPAEFAPLHVAHVGRLAGLRHQRLAVPTAGGAPELARDPGGY